MKKIGEIVRGRKLITASPEMDVHELAIVMRNNSVSALPVLKDDQLIGLFSERDLTTKVVAESRDPASTKVEDVMTRDLIIAQDAETCEACLQKMETSGIRHLPILAKNKLIGIVTVHDLLSRDLQIKSKEIELMNYFVNFKPAFSS